MVRKKVEGNEEQRRAAGRRAREQGEEPSARGVTTGASKQRTHLPHRHAVRHDERLATRHRGKQRWREDGQERQGRPADGRAAPAPGASAGARYTEAHAAVFGAVAQAEYRHGGEEVHLEEVARTAGLPAGETRRLLHDLVTRHRLVTELQSTAEPDLGPRYGTRAR
ncbi:hypothetical protein GCM10009716_07200 [Streptomyces sodiiphilus]|uniref:HTH iclR-type domain-containing protein n=2 Tax=Streptomyces sodiiphilus TaxID=226217 RepID=A0ABN2NS62_9ACTN